MMAKRGGFTGMPGNMNNLMKQAQRMQRQMEEMQKEMETMEFEGTAGGEAVKVVVTGKKQMVSVELEPEVVDPDDIEMLQDLIVAATNELFGRLKNIRASRLVELAEASTFREYFNGRLR